MAMCFQVYAGLKVFAKPVYQSIPMIYRIIGFVWIIKTYPESLAEDKTAQKKAVACNPSF